MQQTLLHLISFFVWLAFANTDSAQAFPTGLMGSSHDSQDKLAVPVADEHPPSRDRLPVADGVVDRYLLHPRGGVNGLLLRDGSQMYVTYRAAEGLMNDVQPGDHVRVYGRRGSDSTLVTPDVIVNVTDDKTFTVPYRLDLPIPPTENQPTVNQMRAAGTIQILLYDYLKGGINGMLLSDGTQVRLPPDVGERFPASLEQNLYIEVEGYGTTTNHGRVLEATTIARKGGPVTPLDAATKELR
ncbi:hypothetical protein W02_09250 [Nitrospira sp. KM1]|uniref:hypothetical protein n=1 Tax=Nitrospira sp. KM1 TaxID=1936990 RepID=UPI0013A77951|nr:hypothetical protein [Nitrospira sp. KM1]BCA53785.1 hypothetical protein W02_09250 [Nitrospira sp. KM1]